jgi:hypothetical protein
MWNWCCALVSRLGSGSRGNDIVMQASHSVMRCSKALTMIAALLVVLCLAAPALGDHHTGDYDKGDGHKGDEYKGQDHKGDEYKPDKYKVYYPSWTTSRLLLQLR